MCNLGSYVEEVSNVWGCEVLERVLECFFDSALRGSRRLPLVFSGCRGRVEGLGDYRFGGLNL